MITDKCADCGLSSSATKFCAETGKPHVTLPVCDACGLSTPFCPVSGMKHGASKPSQQQLRRRGIEPTSSAQVAELQKQAAQESIEYALNKERFKRAHVKPVSEKHQELLEALSTDGFGIFAPGNPALAKVQAGAAGHPVPAEELSGAHRLTLPDSVVNDILNAASGGKLTDEQRVLLDRYRKPSWARKIAPILKAAIVVLLVITVLGALQLSFSTMRRSPPM